MQECEFVEFAGKKEYKCPKCKATIRYAKFFGSDKKLLTTDGKEPFGGMVDGKYKSNTGWPTNPNTKQMHECGESGTTQIGSIIIKNATDNTKQQNLKMDQHIGKVEGEIKRTDLLDYEKEIKIEPFTIPQVKELKMDDLPMDKHRGEVLGECTILWKEEEWITDYLLSKGGANPNPAKVGMWHKMIDERLRRVHEPG